MNLVYRYAKPALDDKHVKDSAQSLLPAHKSFPAAVVATVVWLLVGAHLE